MGAEATVELMQQGVECIYKGASSYLLSGNNPPQPSSFTD